MKKSAAPQHEHEVVERLYVDVYYPDHPPRTESALFRKTKRDLIKVKNVPCWVCGTRQNREVHHFYLEWADSAGVDWARMRQLHPDFDWSTFRGPSDFVDSPYNMRILCMKHHRHRDAGIHMLPYPIFVMQAVKRSDFVFAPAIVPQHQAHVVRAA